MPSLIPGYEYDIFISYRQNDNQDGWVTEFINSLNREIKSTFKEDISIYFDENPHDGLHEHHEVDDSLREKLKCLILIPIVSQTYCDPKCFAWEHEFKVFVEQAGNDQFGLKTKLAGSNVANRVLPVKIHDLDHEDEQLFESEVGGVMRSIDFIYSAAGVNRPLTPTDERELNLNKTFYRDQINKVANALKEILSAIKNDSFKLEGADEIQTTESIKEKSISDTGIKSFKKKSIIIGSIAIIAIAIVILVYFIFPKDKIIGIGAIPDKPKNNSLAVMYFENLSGNESLTWLQAGMVEMLITNLGNNEMMNVLSSQSLFNILRQETGSENMKITKQTASIIAHKAKVNQMLLGSFLGSEEELRINTQLVEVNSGRIIKTWILETNESISIFDLVDSLTILIQQLNLQPDTKLVAPTYSITQSLDAQKYYIEGLQNIYRGRFGDAVKNLERAISYDSTFAMAYYQLRLAAGWVGTGSNIKNLLQKALQYKQKLTPREVKFLELNQFSRGNGERIPMIKKYLEEYPMEKYAWYLLGEDQIHTYWLKASVKSFYQALKIDSYFLLAYLHIMDYYSFSHEFDSLKAVVNKVLEIDSNHSYVKIHIANMNFYETGNIDNYISELKPIIKDSSSVVNMVLFGMIDWLKKEYESAEYIMQKSVNKSSTNFYRSFGTVEMASMAYSRGQVSKATELMDIIANWYPNNANIYYSNGLAYFLNNEFTKTIEFSRKIIQLEDLIPEQESFGYHLLGIGNLGIGNLAEADKAASRLEVLINSGENEYDYMLYDLKARINMAKGNFENAYDLFEEAKNTASITGFGPVGVNFFTFAYYGLIECLEKQGKYFDLINEVNKLRIPSWDQISVISGIIAPKAKHQKVRALMALGKIEEGKRAYNDLLELLSDADSNFSTLIQAQAEAAELD